MPSGLPPQDGQDGPFDGPWVRSAREIEEMWQAVSLLVDTISARRRRSAAEFSHAERYVLGVRAAARWTIGVTARGPHSGEELALDRERVVADLALANLLRIGGGVGGDPAAGVHAWLAWLTGASHVLPLPAV